MFGAIQLFSTNSNIIGLYKWCVNELQGRCLISCVQQYSKHLGCSSNCESMIKCHGTWIPTIVCQAIDDRSERTRNTRTQLYFACDMFLISGALQEDSYIQYTSSGPREGALLQRLEAQQREAKLEPLTMRCFDSFATKDDAGKVKIR